MKTIFCFLCAFAVCALSSCDSTNKDPSLTITKSSWYTTTEGSFGYVYLHLEGSTSGEKVSVLTHGDGLNSYKALTLNADKSFNEDICVAFTAAPDSTASTYSTSVIAYEKSAAPDNSSESGNIGSGETEKIDLTSDPLIFTAK